MLPAQKKSQLKKKLQPFQKQKKKKAAFFQQPIYGPL
jgi:hypothetical protein